MVAIFAVLRFPMIPSIEDFQQFCGWKHTKKCEFNHKWCSCIESAGELATSDQLEKGLLENHASTKGCSTKKQDEPEGSHE